MERTALEALSKDQIIQIFRKLNGGTSGFNHAKPDKAACIDRLLSTYTPEQIATAMPTGDEQPPVEQDAPPAIEVEGELFATDEVPPVKQAAHSRPAAAAPTVDSQDAAAQLGAALAAIMGKNAPKMDEERVREIAREILTGSPIRVTVDNKVTGEVKDIGIQHRAFPILFDVVTTKGKNGKHLNAWLYGPAGTGKTTAAAQVAKALDRPFRYNGALTGAHELLGFVDGMGRYHRTPFRDVWENGGVYLFDEIDASDPSAPIALNGALAGTHCSFPDSVDMIERHPDAIFIAGANTAGLAGSTDYVGTFKMNVAFRDRWEFIAWDIDEQLEEALSDDATWTARVRQIRTKVAERGIKGIVISPRATISGSALLRKGMPRHIVEEVSIRKGMDEATWRLISK